MQSELIVRVLVFAVVFAALIALQTAFPKRQAALSAMQRWPGAGALFIAGAVLARLVVPAGLAGIALWADSRSLGLFNQVDAPMWLVGVASLLILDLAVWAQHVAMHHVPFLWRMHRVHHADPHIDVTTALRFHPAEILVSLIWKAAIVIAFGIPAWAAFVFEIALNAFAQFNHANWAMPKRADSWLRQIVVTPDMHRVHHSVVRAEANRNFGFCLSIWDRLFRLYKPQPDGGHDGMVIGQSDWRTADDQTPLALLVQPLKRPSQPG